MNNKCVYIHKLDGVVVYVGSGNISRCYAKTGRNKKHLEVWDNLVKEIHIKDLSSEDSLNIEQLLIDMYWETGNLFNKSKKVVKVREIDWKLLKSLFYYDNTSPTYIRWVVDKFRGKSSTAKLITKDAPAGSIVKKYGVVRCNGIHLLIHRVIYSLYHQINLDTSLVIDHIDGNPRNNDISNLRAISRSENSKNKITQSSTKEKCIYHDTKSKVFKVEWLENTTRKWKNFSYSVKSLYKTKENAFTAAVEFRDSLVTQGIIYKPRNL